MGIYNLEKLFNPGSVAVIGASSKTGTIGELAISNLQRLDFNGEIFPVNPKYKTICGLPCLPDISYTDKPVDLAVIATPIQRVPDILCACVKQKVKSTMVVSDGRRVSEARRTQILEQIAQISYQGSIRVLGPNSLGIVNTAVPLNITYSDTMPAKGKMAFVSQSGSLYTATLDMSFKEKMGFSYFINVGDLVDIDFGDLVDFLGNDDNVDSILLYIRNLKNPRKFLSAARSVSPSKPIVVLRPGPRSKSVVFTADKIENPAFEDAVYDAAFKRAGIISVDSIDDMFDCAEIMAKQPHPSGDHLVVINNGSAPGAKAVDMMVQCDIPPRPLSQKTTAALDQVLPSYWKGNNPINLLSGAGVDNYIHAVQTCLNDKSINGLLITMAPEAETSPTAVAKKLVDCVKNARIPVMAAWYGGRDMTKGIQIFNEAGIPTFRTPEKAVKAFSHLIEYNRNQETALEIPAGLNRRLTFDRNTARSLLAETRLTGTQYLDIAQTRKLLTAYGIPLAPAKTITTKDQAIEAADAIGYPVVMRSVPQNPDQADTPEMLEVDLRTPEELKQAFERMISNHSQKDKIISIQVQTYIPRPDYKLYLGIKKDKKFGPILLFGIGGMYSLLIGERNLGLPPLNRLLARHLMEKTRAFELLTGYRDRKSANIEELEELLIRMAQMAVDIPQIERLDIHPIIVKNGRTIVAGAQAQLSPTPVVSPKHLVISPYPAGQARTATLKDGAPVSIRPIKPEDAPLLIQFIDTLSDTSIYYRFFRHIREFTPRQIHRFSTIDYDREIALIVLSKNNEKETMIGVIRIIGHPDGKKGDFYIVISDAWQGKGIGLTLLQTGLEISRQQGYQTIYGMVLPENEWMRKLARNIGFEIKFNLEEKVFDLSLDLASYNPVPEPETK